MLELKDIMTTAVVTISPDDPLRRVRDIFEETGFHHLLVVEDNRLVGIISDRDLLRHLSPFIGRTMMERRQDVNTLKLRAHQVMTREPVTAHPEMPALDAGRRLLERGVSCLPIVGAGHRIQGIVTWRDLLPHCFECPIEKPGVAGLDRPMDEAA